MVNHDAAIAALERNAWSMFTALGWGQGGNVIDTPTRLVVETPVRQPPYNAVWRFYDEQDRPLDEQVDELLARFIERDVVGMWLVHPTTPPALRPRLTAGGVVCAEELFGMIGDLDHLDPIPPTAADVEVHESGADEPDEWMHLVSWRYGLDTSTSPYLADLYPRALAGGTRVWIARVEGAPTSKVTMHIDAHGVAGIYGVVTTDAGRGRGFASTLTLTALHAARASGATIGVLHSTPMARNLYSRLGFHDVATFEAWAEPDRLHL